MLEILSGGHTEIRLPNTFNSDTMYAFLEQALTSDADVRFKTIDFDFGDLKFIAPVGVVVLSNLVEFLRRAGVSGYFRNVFGTNVTPAVAYLDDSGFFEKYHKGRLRTSSFCKPGTLPLTLVPSLDTFTFLNSTMIPWIAKTLDTSEQSLATVRVCLEEVLQNVSDHSGVEVGCVHAQLDESNGTLEIAISDFGYGIPNKVRAFAATGMRSNFDITPTMNDSAALKLACKQGFTTKSNVRNRGAGLPNLLSVVTGRDRGHLMIVSGHGMASAVHRRGETQLTVRTKRAVYPGTLVRVILKCNVVQDFEKDIEQQEFSWT